MLYIRSQYSAPPGVGVPDCSVVSCGPVGVPVSGNPQPSGVSTQLHGLAMFVASCKRRFNPIKSPTNSVTISAFLGNPHLSVRGLRRRLTFSSAFPAVFLSCFPPPGDVSQSLYGIFVVIILKDARLLVWHLLVFNKAALLHYNNERGYRFFSV